jgi:hypothetical protein
LNRQYEEGYSVDIEAIEKDKPQETHCGSKAFRLIKN